MAADWVITAVIMAALSTSVMPFCTVIEVNNTREMISKGYTFVQPLDHFNAQDHRKLNQMVWERCDFYEKDGPVFLLIGGYRNITDPWPENSILEDYAKEHKALVFQLEHRYYGNSTPKIDTSYLEVTYLKYLTSSQALMDLARFIQTMNRIHPLLNRREQPPRWVAFGCSYGGSLASWMRAKYPHLVYAAVASSAPLLARHDSPEYIDDIANSIEKQRKNCGTEITLALYSLKRSGNICNDGEVELDERKVTNILPDLGHQIIQLVQNGTHVSTFCDIMLDNSVSSPEDRFALGLNHLGFNMTKECELNHSICLDNYKKTDWVPDKMCPEYRQFMYQQCSEFGHFQSLGETSDETTSYSSTKCTSIFGQTFSDIYIRDAIKRTNSKYGGLNLQASRLISIHGALDPWRTLGLTSSNSTDSITIVMEGVYQQCADQRRPPSDNSTVFGSIQAEVSRTLGQWLKEEESSRQTAEDTLHLNQDVVTSDYSQIPWWCYLLVALLFCCVVVVVIVIVKFRKKRENAHI